MLTVYATASKCWSCRKPVIYTQETSRKVHVTRGSIDTQLHTYEVCKQLHAWGMVHRPAYRDKGSFVILLSLQVTQKGNAHAMRG